jgi:O-antigen ligase
LFFRTSDEGVSSLDVFFATFFFGTLFLWFFTKIFIQRKRIVYSVADFFLLIFPLLTIGTLVLSLLNQITLLNSLREYVMFNLLLFYFPIRENFTDKKNIINLGISFSLSVLATDMMQFYDYYTEFSKGIRYAYQIMTGERINQTVFTFAILAGTLFFLYPQKIISRIWLLFIVSLTSIALVTTSSRTFWILTLFGFVLFLFFLPMKQKILLSVTSSFMILIFVLTVTLFFQDKAEIVYKAVSTRFTSSTQGKKDISVAQRLVEYEAVYKKIFENPLGGNGYAKKFTFYSKIDKMTLHSIYTHNGYLFFIYRYGIPLAFIYFFILFYHFVKSIYLSIKIKDDFYKFIAIAGFLGLYVLVISSMTSAQFINRDGIFILAISYALSERASKYFKENELNPLSSISAVEKVG